MNVLASELRLKLEGDVQFDAAARALYATDASNYRQIPIGVVLPRTKQDVIHALEICRRHGAPVLTRGAGTSLAGQGCNTAVILDFSRYMNRILEIDPAKKIARVEPGVVLDHLRSEAKKHGLTFGPDPATHSRCTLGGMIGNNACGVHSVVFGKTAENTESLEVLTYEGQILKVGKTSEEELTEISRRNDARGAIYKKLLDLRNRYADLIRARTPKLPRRVSGYNLEELLPEHGFQVARSLVGTEGTCVIVLEAEVKLAAEPPGRALAVLGYPDIYHAADHISEILSHRPAGVEGLDEFFVRNMKKSGLHLNAIAELPAGNGWLLVEFGGKDDAEAEARARAMINKTAASGRLFSSQADQKKIWAMRESSFGASVFVPGEKDTFSGFEDSAVPPAKLGAYLRELRKLYDRYDYEAITYGHFGDGCIHTRISFDLKTDPGIQNYMRFLEEAADLVVKFGGSFSGEHGDGQTWGHLLHKMYGKEMVEAFREFKSIWDPQNKMNPGKVVDAYLPDENLRLKTYETIRQGKLHFHYPQDGDNFARTTERCIGIGKCLQTNEGTMCPSYMATRDEKHSTRGRAHLLHEMMRGEVIRDGWKSKEVKEALDLCLACKACKSECPVKVDMATYKAEFLSHYYKHHPRPRSAYAFGWISFWANIASAFPRLTNFFTQTPGFSRLSKWMAGASQQRTLPKFAMQTFRRWFKKRSSSPSEGEKGGARGQVLLWPDTFTNTIYPEIAKAAVRVMEKLGYRVLIPENNLCCGRPFYDYGFMDQAKASLQKILHQLRPHLESGAQIVGLEPSCISVFRDDALQLFPEDETAKKLAKQSFLFHEWAAPLLTAPGKIASSKVWVHGHCHEKAVMGMSSTAAILSKLQVPFELLDAGCCGMAGAFGFEAEHDAVSRKIGEGRLVPLLNTAPAGTLVLTNGFSCREQITALTGRRALHLAEFLDRIYSDDSARGI